MRALTGFAHAGYAALHVREMLSHGDSDPLQTNSIRAIDGNRHRKLSAHLLGIFWLSIHAMIAPRTERSSCCRDTGGAQTGTVTVRCGDGPGGTGSCARVLDRKPQARRERLRGPCMTLVLCHIETIG